MSLGRGSWTVNDPAFVSRLKGIAPHFGIKVVQGNRRGEEYVLLEIRWRDENFSIVSLDDRGWRAGLITAYLFERLQMRGISLHIKLAHTGDAKLLFWKGGDYTVETEARPTLLEALIDACEEVVIEEKGSVQT